MLLGPNVLLALNLQAHLASQRRVDQVRLVGSTITTPVNGEQYLPDVEYVVPAASGGSPEDTMIVSRRAKSSREQGDSGDSPGADAPDASTPPVDDAPAGGDSAGGDATGGGSEGEGQELVAVLDRDTLRSGVYEAWSEDLEGRRHVRRFALNVDPEEGDLRIVDQKQLRADLEPVKPNFLQVNEMYDIVTEAGFNPSLWIMGLLIALLVAEQILAYLFSYHTARQGDAR